MEVFEKQLKSSIDDQIDSKDQLNKSVNYREEKEIIGRICLDHSQTAMQTRDIDSLLLDEEFNGLEEILGNFEKLSKENIAIETNVDNMKTVIPLNLDETHFYSLFPGQNVVVKGNNPTRSGFVVSDVIHVLFVYTFIVLIV